MVNGAGEPVWRKPLGHRFGVEERAVDAFRFRAKDTVKSYGAGAHGHLLRSKLRALQIAFAAADENRRQRASNQMGRSREPQLLPRSSAESASYFLLRFDGADDDDERRESLGVLRATRCRTSSGISPEAAVAPTDARTLSASACLELAARSFA